MNMFRVQKPDFTEVGAGLDEAMPISERSSWHGKPRLKMIAAWVLALAATNIFAAPQAPPQPRSDPSDAYNHALDKLLGFDPSGHEGDVFAISVLLMFPSRPEVRISISLKRGGDATVEYLTSDRNIGRALIETNEHLEIESIIKTIKVSRQSIKMLPGTAFEWQQRLFGALAGTATVLNKTAQDYSNTGAIMLTMDADSYRVAYIQNQTKLNINLSESQAENAAGATPTASVTSWCKALEADIRARIHN